VSKAAVRLLSTEFGVLSQLAHEAPAELISQAIDAVQTQYKRAAYREIFDRINAVAKPERGL